MDVYIRLTHPTRALIALIIVSSRQMSGYLMVIYIAGLTNVPKRADQEAARVDGATGWQTIMKVKIAINPQYDSNLYFLIYFKNLYVILI